MAISFKDVLKARELIQGLVHRTPVHRCSYLDKLSRLQLFFKCENLQKTGSSKGETYPIWQYRSIAFLCCRQACTQCNGQGSNSCETIGSDGAGVSNAEFVLYISALQTTSCGSTTLAFAGGCEMEDMYDRLALQRGSIAKYIHHPVAPTPHHGDPALPWSSYEYTCMTSVVGPHMIIM